MPTSTQRGRALCLRPEVAIVGSLGCAGALILGGRLLTKSPDEESSTFHLKPPLEPRGVILSIAPTLHPVTAAPTTSTEPSSSPPSLHPTKVPSAKVS